MRKSQISLNVSTSLLGDDLQVIEVRHGICLGPQSDLARPSECVIGRFDFFGAVVVTEDPVSEAFDAQFMPFARRDFEVRSRELAAVASGDSPASDGR